ncbi:major facilitator superfamily domain-containing protein [Boletus coccyginus]|nr:major facilitator superfamily domain-containing protein [Boletus coccyginus]
MVARSSSTSPGINLREFVINPNNLKCSSLPVFSLRNQYSINFHLAWLGYFVAFLSWFAFSPLIPGVIKEDLKLTTVEVGNSNVVSLCATLVARVVAGPLVDRFGPRKVMAAFLVLGTIPSGLAGTANTANGLYLIRFFIGILGGTFVPCQAWTTTFFDKNVVGSANAIVGGLGNSGGGVTFLVMTALYDGLLSAGLVPTVAWRAAFAIVPVPCLLLVSLAILVFGTDHPAGKWCDRHKAIAYGRENPESTNAPADSDERVYDTLNNSRADLEKKSRQTDIQVTGAGVQDMNMVSELDYAVTEPLTLGLALKIAFTPLTWLPALGYFTTLGYELAMNTNLAHIFLSLYKSESFSNTEAGYLTCTFGFMNIFARGYLGDLAYRRWGVAGKKYLGIILGIAQGFLSIGLVIYIDRDDPSLSVMVCMIIMTAASSEAAGGATFALVPHCSPRSNGFMSGIVGAMGSVGGIIFALVFRLQPLPIGRAFWISGAIAVGINLLTTFIGVPRV